ncbi:MAG: FCD domain-containing protein [Pseudomonadota bacterium]
MTNLNLNRIARNPTADPDAAEDTAVLSALRQIIEGEKLPSNGRLPTEREIAAELGCGRRAVRRALDQLEQEGLIWRRQGKGTFAGQAPDPAEALAAEIAPSADALAVMEARLCIEPGLADLCAQRATARDVERLRDLVRRAAEPYNAETAELWDGALHRAIARIAGNRILLTAFAMLDEVRRGTEWQEQRHRARSPETMTLSVRQHTLIVDAIAARDGAGAAAAMQAHLLALTERLRASIEEPWP